MSLSPAFEPHVPGRPRPRHAAFSLVEMLAVVTVLGVMLVLIVPVAMRSRGGDGMTAAAYEISGVLQEARSYAMANNTYVWVGLFEEDAGTLASSGQSPANSGTGRLVISTVTSMDGTAITAAQATPGAIEASRITPTDKLTVIENVHLTSLGAPPGGAAGSFSGRPAPSAGAPMGLNSDSSEKTKFPFTIGNHTFAKTVRFSPRGEAMINGNGDLYPVAEIGLRPTHGSQVDARSGDIAAIQITGIAGNVTIYQP